MELKTENEFEKAREDFEATRIAKLAKEQFAVKPYYLEYQGRYYAAVASSYFFNLVSVISAFSLVHFFFYSMTGSHVMSGVLTIIPLALLEFFKRDAFKELFTKKKQFGKTKLGLLVMCLIYSLISIGGSYPGGQKLVHELSSDYEGTEADTLEDMVTLKEQVAELRKERDVLPRNSEGDTYYKVLPAYNDLVVQIAALDKEILDMGSQQRKDNRTGETLHDNNVSFKAEYFSIVTIVTIVAELLYILCMYYIVSYMYNSMTDFAKNKETRETDGVDGEVVGVTPTKPTDVVEGDNNVVKDNNVIVSNPELDNIQAEIKKVKKKISTYNSRLRKRKVTRETYDNSMARFNDELKELLIKKAKSESESKVKLKAV